MKTIGLLIALALLGGCTTVTVVYRNDVDPQADFMSDRRECAKRASYIRCMQSKGWTTEAWEVP
jgi:hypothetical protein